MAAVTGAIIGAAGALGGAAMSSSAAKKAGKAQERAAQSSIVEQQRQYDLSRQDAAPYREAGTAALNRLTDPNAFQASPGFQFARDQALDAIKTQQNSLGRLASGNTLAALNDRAQSMASQEYNNWWNQQAGLAGMGSGVTNQLASLGANTAANVGNTMMAGADGRASGIAGSANAWNTAFGTIGGIAQNYGNKLTGQSGMPNPSRPFSLGLNDPFGMNKPTNRLIYSGYGG